MEDQNEVVVPETTKQKKSPALVIILIIFALAGIGFGVYGMFFNKTETTECISETKNDSPEVTKKEDDFTVYYDLVKKYIDHSAYEYHFERNGFDDENYMAETAVKEIRTAGNIESISVAELNEKVYELFNYDFSNVEEIDMICGRYTISDKIYYRQGGGCGGAGNTASTFTISNVEQKDDSLVIDVVYANVVYGPPEDDGKTLSLKDKSDNVVYSDVGRLYEGDGIKRVKQFFENNLDLFQKYRLVFKKAEKHYYLESGEKID